jgi:ribose transport system substrate-binding protein
MFKVKLRRFFISVLAVLLIMGSVAYANFYDDLKGLGIKANGEPVRVAISVSDLSSDMSVNMFTSLKIILEHAGANVVSFTSAEYDPGLQISNLEDLMQLNLDALVIQPVDEYAVVEALKKFRESGVQIININKSAQTPVDFFVGINNAQYGEVMGEMLADWADGREVKILETQGQMSLSLATGRSTGFSNAIKKYKNLKLVNQAPCEWMPEKALAATIDTLSAHPDLRAVFSHSDCMLPGILSGLKQSNRLKKNDEDGHIWIGTIDGTAQAVDELKNTGYNDVVLDQSGVMHGIIAAKAILEKVVKGEPIGGIRVFIAPIPVTIKNAYDDSVSANYDVRSGLPWSHAKAVWDAIDLETTDKEINFTTDLWLLK